MADYDVLLFDDLELNVNSAKQVGMHAFHTSGIGKLEDELLQLGVI
ncbi:MAG: hypothetical protein ACE5JF_06855 [Anaerolineales bacterium]